MKTTLAVLVVIMACSYVATDVANYYCGRRLSEVLASLCWEGETTAMKRDSGWWHVPGPMMAVRALAGMRGKRGPVDECCFKPCTVDELMTYC